MKRPSRKNDYLPIAISVLNRNTGAVLIESFPGHIINISKQGACLFLSRVMDGNFHIFHTTREKESLLLQLNITAPPNDTLFSLTVHPVWLDLFQQEQHRGFAMGVEFVLPRDGEQMRKFQKAIKSKRKERCAQFHQ